MTTVELLEPISLASPGGSDLEGDQRFIRLAQGMRQLVGGSVPDYDKIASSAETLLATASKDLQVAVIYAEAMVHIRGFAGLHRGLRVVAGLLERHWDTLYPRDIGQRRGPLAKLSSDDFAVAIRLQPLNGANHSFWQFQQASRMPTEADADDSAKRQQRVAMIAEYKLSPEMFWAAVHETPKEFYQQLVGDLRGSLAAVASLDATAKRQLADDPPSFRTLRLTIQAVYDLVKTFPGLELDDEPDETSSQRVGGNAAAGVDASPVVVSANSNGSNGTATPPVGDDPEERVIAAATGLRRANPRDPTPYLLLRALRWGELRAGGFTPSEKLLVSPQPDTRSRLRALHLDGRWDALLDATELAMSTRAGRGWLDLQFYAVRACERLGAPFDGVRIAIVGALQSLLTDIPSLPSMTLMDALPVAAPETMTWLTDEIIAGSVVRAHAARSPSAPSADDVYAAARLEAASGTTERAVELLARELAHESSERRRFLRQTQIAAIMVDKGRFATAQPLLAKLIAQADKLSLAEWEEGAVVAEPLTLMIKCLDARGEKSEERDKHYVRVCTLSPVMALGLARS